MPPTKALPQVLLSLRKKHGKESIQFGGVIQQVEAFPTGILQLDKILGVGGLPKGRVIEIFGPEAGGKTTLSLRALAMAQKQGWCGMVDAEHALDPAWATKHGVDIPNLLLSQPSSGDEGLQIVLDMVKSQEVKMIVVDSVAALVPKEELDGELTDHHLGAQARMMSKCMRNLAAEAAKSGTTVIFINQIREKIGVMFGSPETTPGGRALKYYASVRLAVRRGENIGQPVYGHNMKIKVVKNKVAPPFFDTLVPLYYGSGKDGITGFDEYSGVLIVGPEVGSIELRGSNYYDADTKECLGNGQPASIAALKANPALFASILEKTYAKMREATHKSKDAVAEMTDEDYVEALQGEIPPDDEPEIETTEEQE